MSFDQAAQSDVYLCSVSSCAVSRACSIDGGITVWQLSDQYRAKRRAFDINFCYLTPEGDELWCQTAQGVSIHDATTLDEIRNIKFDFDDNGILESPRSLGFCSKHGLAAIALPRGELVIWDRTNWSEVARLRLTDIRESDVRDLSFSLCGRWLATAGEDHTIRVLETSTWQECFRIDSLGLDGNVEFSPLGKTIAIALSDGQIVLLENGTWREIARSTAPISCSNDCLRFSTDGTIIASGHRDSVVRLWHGRTMSLLGELRGHPSEINGITLDRSGKSLVTTSREGSIRVWDLATRSHLGIIQQNKQHPAGVWFSPDGRRLYFSDVVNLRSRWKGTLVMWSIDSTPSDTDNSKGQSHIDATSGK